MNWLRLLGDGLIVTIILEGAFRVKGPVFAKKAIAYILTLALLVAEVFLLYSTSEESSIFFWHPYIAYGIANLVYIILRLGRCDGCKKEFLFKRIILWQLVFITIFSGAVLSCGWLMKLYIRPRVQVLDDAEVRSQVLSEISLGIEPVEGIAEGYVMAVDADKILEMEAEGVSFKDYEGNPQDVYKTLNQAGVNYVYFTVPTDDYRAIEDKMEELENLFDAMQRVSQSDMRVILNIDSSMGFESFEALLKYFIDNEISVRYIFADGKSIEETDSCMAVVDRLSGIYERRIGTVMYKRAGDERTLISGDFDSCDYVCAEYEPENTDALYESLIAGDKKVFMEFSVSDGDSLDSKSQAENIRNKCELNVTNGGKGIIVHGVEELFDDSACPKDSLFTFGALREQE